MFGMPGKIGRTGSLQAADGKRMGEHSLLSSARGVTLIEVMIALVVLLIVFMGLIQAALLSIDHNLRNEVRDEAVRIAAEAMTNLKAEGFSGTDLGDNSGSHYSYPGISPDPLGALLPTAVQPGSTPSRSFRNFSQPYTVGIEVRQLDGNNKQVTIRVHYTYRTDAPVTYTINSVVVNPAALN
jgi:prepilin-type N-terminal cleavage/methylation domain-containing protein